MDVLGHAQNLQALESSRGVLLRTGGSDHGKGGGNTSSPRRKGKGAYSEHIFLVL